MKVHVEARGQFSVSVRLLSLQKIFEADVWTTAGSLMFVFFKLTHREGDSSSNLSGHQPPHHPTTPQGQSDYSR